MVHKLKKHHHYSYKTQTEAQKKAEELRKHGHRVHVHRDSITGKWIVTVLVLGLSLGIVAAVLRPR